MRIAKLILSKILDQEIETLEFKPTEFRKKIGLNLTVFRIDFSAVIRQEDGSRKLVLIEIQKAKLPTDIMRFRKYLGGQYQDPNNVYPTEDGASEKALSRACSGTFPLPSLPKNTRKTLLTKIHNHPAHNSPTFSFHSTNISCHISTIM
ncbi:MAG: hypothetical protein WGN25_12350 [Candidatus Electrothrix sp. GW3-4]|uniref:hypothetical protein n=1 Tax=Candidatus Electrothrix sp. GW3-4 TaxID=3126740 RepID=UPI0030CB1195